jgi:hypothetical protein
VLGAALAAYLIGLSVVQLAAPRPLPRIALVARAAVAAGALGVAVCAARLDALPTVAIAAGGLVVQVALEGRRWN